MYYKREEDEFQYHPAIENCIEDYTGGVTIARKDFKGIDELPPGAIIGVDERGLGHVIKTAKVTEVVTAEGKVIKVAKGHFLIVGDAIAKTSLDGVSSVITAIVSGETFDTITVTNTLTALAIGEVLIQAKAEANSAEIAYTPVGIGKHKVNLTVANQQLGVMARGSAKEKVMCQPIDNSIKSIFSLIRFV